MRFIAGLVIVFGFGACAHFQSNMRSFECPDGSSVHIEKSDSENNYLRYSSEQARGLAACAKESGKEASQAAVDKTFGD